MEKEQNSIDEKTEKLHLKAKNKAKKKMLFLEKMKNSNPFKRVLIYSGYHFKTFTALWLYFIVIFGIIGGITAKSLFEIWKVIFAVSL